MQDQQALLAQIRVTNGHQKVVLHLLEHLEPRLTLVGRLELGRVSTTHIENLHVVLFQRFKLATDHYIYKGVGEKNFVKIA